MHFKFNVEEGAFEILEIVYFQNSYLKYGNYGGFGVVFSLYLLTEKNR